MLTEERGGKSGKDGEVDFIIAMTGNTDGEIAKMARWTRLKLSRWSWPTLALGLTRAGVRCSRCDRSLHTSEARSEKAQQDTRIAKTAR